MMIMKSFFTTIVVIALSTDMCNARSYDRYDDDYYYEDYHYRGRYDDYYDRKGGKNRNNVPQCLEARGGSDSAELRVPRKFIERSNAIEVAALTDALCCLHVAVRVGGSGQITYRGGNNPNNVQQGRSRRNNKQVFRDLNTFEEAYVMVLKEICNERSYFYEGESVGRQVCEEQEECIEEAIEHTPLWHGKQGHNPYMPFEMSGPGSSIFVWSSLFSALTVAFYFFL